jgi:small subunit ribosomal protein S20
VRSGAYRTGAPAPPAGRPAGENPLVHWAAVANIKSQKKRNRQNVRRHERNTSVRSSLKTAVKKTRVAAEQGDLEAAQANARDASRALDKAVSGGVLHKRTAARRKSRLTRAVAASSAE